MFLYYLPGVEAEKVTRQFLLGGPLAPIFWDLLRSPALYDARIRSFAIHAHGPDKSSGAIVAAMPKDGRDCLVPAMRPGQTWVHVNRRDQQDYWIGYDLASQPDPELLQREHIVHGQEHELGDGQIWVCPIVRRKAVINALPCRWGVDPETGDYAGTMLPRYNDAWLAAGRILNAQTAGEIERPEALELCVQMLAINYRIGLVEASLLGLLDDTNWKYIWRAATDADFLDEWLASQGTDGTVKKE